MVLFASDHAKYPNSAGEEISHISSPKVQKGGYSGQKTAIKDPESLRAMIMDFVCCNEPVAAVTGADGTQLLRTAGAGTERKDEAILDELRQITTVLNEILSETGTRKQNKTESGSHSFLVLFFDPYSVSSDIFEKHSAASVYFPI